MASTRRALWHNRSVPITELDRDACYRALCAHDARFDGRFFTAVRTTKVYCRPICPARTPKLENCIFVRSAAEAHQLGFRPCLRCRPEIAPGVAAWTGTASSVTRALALIAEGGLDDDDVDAFAVRLGVGSRHLRRLFARHLGASPLAVARTRRILFAKQLITQTALPMADVGLAAGFGSVRRFNDVIRQTYGRAPRELRRTALATPVSTSTGVTLQLAFRPPYDWASFIAFMTPRATPGVEIVEPHRYCRTVEFGDARGRIDVRPVNGKHHLLATIEISQVTALAPVAARIRRLLDLDADAVSIDEHLAHDGFASHVASRPGVRIPGAWDDFELAVRAILGQQVSVAAATTLAGRLVAAFGRTLDDRREPARLFPTPRVLADADIGAIGLPRARANAIAALARALCADPTLLRSADSLEATIERLCRLPGIGAWTAQYIAMRALHEPDAFPATDLGLLRASQTEAARPTPAFLLASAERWRPWRAYAAMRLWLQGAAAEAS